MDAAPHPIDDLLVHAEFLRRLARDLTGDPADGDDLAQRVWVRALERPPHHAGALRGWLARTARRLWSNERRDAFRRRRREADAAPADPAPSPTQILAREQTREQVVRAVLELPAPFRQAVLMRYFDGLEPAEIATRLALPAATVRTRLHRGLERVRNRLDEAHGDRAAWLPLVAALPTPPPPHATALAAPILMKKLVTALTLLAIAFVVVRILPLGPAAAPPAPPPGGAAVATADSQASLPKARADAAATQRAPAFARPGDAPVFPADRARGQLRVLVHDDRGPRAGVVVVATPRLGPLPALQHLADDRSFTARATTDARGTCVFADLPEGPVHLEARVAELRQHGTGIVSADATQRVKLLRLPDTASRLSHELCVTHAFQPVAGAEVRFYGWPDDEAAPLVGETLPTTPIATMTSDDDGVVRLEAATLQSGVAIARTPDGLAGFVSFEHASGRQLPLEVDRTANVRGRLRIAAADGLQGATIELCALWSTHSYVVFKGHGTQVPVREGAFAADDLPAGTYGVVLRGAGGLRLANGEPRQDVAGAAWMQTIELLPGETAEPELDVVVGARIEGRVTCDGAPVQGATVRVLLTTTGTGSQLQRRTADGAPYWSAYGSPRAPRNPVTSRTTATDADGRYVLDGLAEGTHSVEVAAPGCSFETRTDVRARREVPTVLQHDLTTAGVLQLAARGVSVLILRRMGDAVDTVHAECQGVCTLPGLRAGVYTITRGLSGSGDTSPVALGTAEVVAGRTTWVDLRRRGVTFRLTGVVRSGARPIAGAIVAGGVTNESGEFVREYDARPRNATAPSVQFNDATFWMRHHDPFPSHVDVQLGERYLDVVCLGPDDAPRAAAISLRCDIVTGPLKHVSIELRTGEDGVARIGPIPHSALRGYVLFTDGHSRILSIGADETRVEVRRPATTALTVRVERDGTPAPGVLVVAARWAGDGPAPESHADYLAGATGQTSHTDATGVATLAVERGEHLIVAASSVTPAVGPRTYLRFTVPDAPTAEVTVETPLPR